MWYTSYKIAQGLFTSFIVAFVGMSPVARCAKSGPLEVHSDISWWPLSGANQHFGVMLCQRLVRQSGPRVLFRRRTVVINWQLVRCPNLFNTQRDRQHTKRSDPQMAGGRRKNTRMKKDPRPQKLDPTRQQTSVRFDTVW